MRSTHDCFMVDELDFYLEDSKMSFVALAIAASSRSEVIKEDILKSSKDH